MTPEERFWSKVKRGTPDGCWLWSGALHRTGYGRVNFCRSPRTASRVAYELAHGPIPAGLHVLHRCDVRACCNPAHLFAGTNAENMRDKIAKGRQLTGENASWARLSCDDVRAMRALRAGGERVGDIARRFGVHIMTASDAIRGRTWRHVA